MKTIFVVSFFGMLSSLSQAAYYQDVLVCDGNAAKVQVDIGERRNLRLILSNPEIKSYFVRSITASRNDVQNVPPYHGNLSTLFPTNSFNQPQLEFDLTAYGSAKEGIFQSSNFKEFTAGENLHHAGIKECGDYSGNGCAGNYGASNPTFIVKRERNGLKVEAWRPRNIGHRCLEVEGYSLYCTQYTQPFGWEAAELANWHFKSCEQKEILP